MKVSLKIFVFVTLVSTLLSADMKCAPGRCGGSMSADVKQTVKKVYKGNIEHKAINIKANEYSCKTCNMLIEHMDYATQAVKKEGETYFFDDIGCMVHWLEKNTDPIVKIYVKTLDIHQWVEAKKANYSRIAPSPMGYGFAAVEMHKEEFISYAKVKQYILSHETLRDPAVRKRLLGE